MNVALNKKALESGIDRPDELTNGHINGYTGQKGFASFRWPGTCTIDLEQNHLLKGIRLLLWDNQGNNQPTPDTRKYKYRLLTSIDNINWTVHFETDEVGTIGWQVFHFVTPVPIRYVRIHGLWCSAKPKMHIVQIEAYTDSVPSTPRKAWNEIQLGHTSKLIERDEPLRTTGSAKGIIDQLRTLAEMHSTILNPQPLFKAADDLELQMDDIERIESSILAVNRRIVEPVTEELKFGRKSGRFSILGFWVGLAGIIISVVLFGLSVLLK